MHVSIRLTWLCKIYGEVIICIDKCRVMDRDDIYVYRREQIDVITQIIPATQTIKMDCTHTTQHKKDN